MVQIAQQRAAAGQHDAFVHDVGSQFGRSLFQRHLDRLDNRPTGSARLSAIWRSVMMSSLGTPFIRSRPLTSMVRPSPSSGGQAAPISFLMRSAERFRRSAGYGCGGCRR
jgi:hypothetical protein